MQTKHDKRIYFLLITFILVVVSASSDDSVSNPIQILDHSTGMDTLTVTFSEEITEIAMPSSISFGSGTYTAILEDEDGDPVHLGLLEHTESTLTFVVLGRNQTTIQGSYSLKVFDSDDDTLLVESEESILFQPWSGSAYTMQNTGGKLNDGSGVMVFVYPEGGDPSDGDAYITNLSAHHFTIFDTEGNRITFTLSPSESGY